MSAILFAEFPEKSKNGSKKETDDRQRKEGNEEEYSRRQRERKEREPKGRRTCMGMHAKIEEWQKREWNVSLLVRNSRIQPKIPSTRVRY